MRIQDVAFARSSDKGDHVDISVFAYNEQSYHKLSALLSCERVAHYFQPMGIGKVECYAVPNLMALKFVIRNALNGGGARSICADNQGKTWSGALLRLAQDLWEDSRR